MTSKLSMICGQVVSSWKNNDGDCVIIVEEKSNSYTIKRGWNTSSDKYEITLSREVVSGFQSSCFRENFGYNKPNFNNANGSSSLDNTVSTGSNVVFYIRDEPDLSEALPGFQSSCFRENFGYGKLSNCDEQGSSEEMPDFIIERIISIDLKYDVEQFLNNIYKTKRAATTELPLYHYLKLIDHYIDETNIYFNFNGIKYEMAFIKKEETLLKALKAPTVLSRSREIGSTMVNVCKDNGNYLSISNICLIFDKFYGYVRGLGFRFEYSDGEAVSYHISGNGDIIHNFSTDHVKYTADRSCDRSSSKNTTVLRLGDRLPEEMISFLKEPVKGHYVPTILFDD